MDMLDYLSNKCPDFSEIDQNELAAASKECANMIRHAQVALTNPKEPNPGVEQDYLCRVKDFARRGHTFIDDWTLNTIFEIFEYRLALQQRTFQKQIDELKRQRLRTGCLQTRNAVQLLSLFVERGFCTQEGEHYKWNRTDSLWGYFVVKATEILEVETESGQIPWKDWVFTFNMDDKHTNNARCTVSRIWKVENGRRVPGGYPPPNGDSEVDAIINEYYRLKE